MSFPAWKKAALPLLTVLALFLSAAPAGAMPDMALVDRATSLAYNAEGASRYVEQETDRPLVVEYRLCQAVWQETGIALPQAYPLINGSGFTLYSHPDEDAPFRRRLPAGAEVYLLNAYVDGLWHFVQYEEETGYISTAYVDASERSGEYIFHRAQDMRVRTGYSGEELEAYLKDGMSGLGEAYAEAEEKYGVNALFMIAICQIESVNGNSGLARNKNNLAGISGRGGWAGFSSKEECIDYLADLLSSRYLDPAGSLWHGSTIAGVSRSYCGGSWTWIANVGNAMEKCWKKMEEE